MDRALQLLGLAARGRKVVSGEFSTEKAIKEGKAALVIVAVDSSDNTKKLFHNMCSFYEVPIVDYATKEALGHCIGKEYRASVAVIDENLAKAVMNKIDGNDSMK